jgi:uncharacterized protein YpuA (DUF1002 family)
VNVVNAKIKKTDIANEYNVLFFDKLVFAIANVFLLQSFLNIDFIEKQIGKKKFESSLKNWSS